MPINIKVCTAPTVAIRSGTEEIGAGEIRSHELTSLLCWHGGSEVHDRRYLSPVGGRALQVSNRSMDEEHNEYKSLGMVLPVERKHKKEPRQEGGAGSRVR